VFVRFRKGTNGHERNKQCSQCTSVRRVFRKSRERCTILQCGGYLWAQPAYAATEHNPREYIKHIRIKDVFIKSEGFGYGTLLMQHFKSYVGKIGIKEIRGSFSFVDDADRNRDRRRRFYEKNGFTFDGDIVTLML